MQTTGKRKFIYKNLITFPFSSEYNAGLRSSFSFDLQTERIIYFLMTFNTRFCFISSSVKQLNLFFSFAESRFEMIERCKVKFCSSNLLQFE